MPYIPAFRSARFRLVGTLFAAVILASVAYKLTAQQQADAPAQELANSLPRSQPAPVCCPVEGGVAWPPVFGPPPSAQEKRKSRLRYSGHSFDEYREFLHNEIEPKARLTNLQPMTTFARHGLEAEVTEAILEILAEYSYSYFEPEPLPEVPEELQPGESKWSEEEIQEDRIYGECVKIVGKIGASAVPVLRKWLKEENRAACSFALFMLPTLGPAAQDALPEVIALTRSKNNLAVADAMVALGDLIKDEKHVPVLVSGLRHSDWEVRCSALEALEILAPKFSRVASKEVLQAIEDRDSRVAAQAIMTAAELDLGIKAVPALIKVIQGDDGRAQEAAYAYLMELGPAAKDAVPAILGVLKGFPSSDKKRQYIASWRYRSEKTPVPVPGVEKIAPPTPTKMMPRNSLPEVDEPRMSPQKTPANRLPEVDEPRVGAAVLKPKTTADPKPRKSPSFGPVVVEPGGGLYLRTTPSTVRMKRDEWTVDWSKFDEFSEALATLEAIGPAAGEAVPFLQELLDSGAMDHGDEIRRTLEKIKLK